MASGKKPAKGAKGASKAAKAKPSAKKAPPRASTPKPAAAERPRPAPAPVPAPDPTFVRRAPAADRKAALEAVLDKEGVNLSVIAGAPAPARPPPAPPVVRESSAADRKAAVEQLVQESGVAGLLAKAPWKRPAPPTPPVPAAPVPAEPQRTAPRATMTKAPIEQTTGRSPPQTVILDTNALMMQFQFHIDIEREVNRILGGNYDVVVPTIVVDELQRLAKEATGKDAGVARMALELAKTFRIVEAPGDGDTGILRLAEKLNAVVVTNDKRLRATLRAKELGSIYMRSAAFLTFEGHIRGM